MDHRTPIGIVPLAISIYFSYLRKQNIAKKEEKTSHTIDIKSNQNLIEKVEDRKVEIEEIKEEEKKQDDKKKCYDCKRKIGLLGNECKCGFVFCKAHRLP